MKKILILLILLSVALIIFLTTKKNIIPDKESNFCNKSNDCSLFGSDGDCNCGCYLKSNLPKNTGGKCFCKAPSSCQCVQDKCQPVFNE